MIRHSRDMLKRVLQVVLPMVILIGIVIGSCQIHISRIGSDMQAVYVKASVNPGRLCKQYSLCGQSKGSGNGNKW